MMSLLDLPAEIVQHVLYMLDPASFYLCLLTSKLMRQHALQSKKLLRHQLDQVPGTRKLSRGVREDASALLMMFSKRAAKHLSNGAAHMVNMHTWKAPRSMNKSLSNIVTWYRTYGCQDCLAIYEKFPVLPRRWLRLLLEVHASIGIINIRSLEGRHGNNDHSTLLYAISPDSLSTFLPKSSEYGAETYQIVRIAWNGACPSGTCASEPSLAILLRTASHKPADTLLIVIQFDPCIGPRVTAKYDIEAPREDAIVSDLAITAEGDPIIMWLYPRTFIYDFMAYKGVTDDLYGTQYLTEEIIYKVHPTKTLPDRFSHMRVQGDNVLFFPTSIQIPLWKGTQTTNRGWKFSRENTNLPGLHAIWHSEALGIPLNHHHHHKIKHRDLKFGAETCVNTALKLVINRKNYDATQTMPLRRGVFILKSVQYPLGCKQFDPYAPNGLLEHIPVAYLADPPDLDNLPTIGLKVAISPRSCRIALAAWRTLKIYSLDPMAFLSPKWSYGSKKTHRRQNPHDFAFINRCGWEYYSSATREGGCVVLEPVDLSSTGVIYALEWSTEDQLWALTNEGVCKWDVGVWANGRAMVSELGQGDGDLKLTRRT